MHGGLEVRRAVQRGWEWRAVCACEAGRAAHRGAREDAGTVSQGEAVNQSMSVYLLSGQTCRGTCVVETSLVCIPWSDILSLSGPVRSLF